MDTHRPTEDAAVIGGFDMGEWKEMVATAPALVQAPFRETALTRDFENYPGFNDWINTQFALGVTSGRIKARLLEIVAEQTEDAAVVWPELSKRDIDSMRSHRAPIWEPLRAKLTQSIETHGVLSKNARLLALLRTAEELEGMMWDERNSRNSQLYLIGEYRATLKQIAEEKGELGETDTSNESKLIQLALGLADQLRIQGSGVQVVDAEGFDYFEEEEGEYSEAPVRGEGTDLQGDGLPSE